MHVCATIPGPEEAQDEVGLRAMYTLAPILYIHGVNAASSVFCNFAPFYQIILNLG